MRAFNRHSAGAGVGGSRDHTDRIRKKREEILAKENAQSGVEVQRQASLRERVKTARQSAAEARIPSEKESADSIRVTLDQLKEKA